MILDFPPFRKSSPVSVHFPADLKSAGSSVRLMSDADKDDMGT